MEQTGPSRDHLATAQSPISYRIAGESVVIELAAGTALLAEQGRLLYRRGEVGWSLQAPGRGFLGKLVNRTQRRLAGVAPLMHRYEGPGELALRGRSPGEMRAIVLEDGDNLIVDRRSLVAATDTVQVDVALHKPLSQKRKHRGTLVLLRLTGQGLVLLHVRGTALDVELREDEVLEAALDAVVCFEATIDYEMRAAAAGTSLWSASRTLLASLSGPGWAVLQGGADRPP